MPPYFRQDNPNTCSLAVLRMVLANQGIKVSEEELLGKVVPDYGNKFSNIWNSTIAKLACQYGITTTMYALWPLLKPGTFQKALNEFREDPDSFNAMKYENPDDKDYLPEPLVLAYKEMFLAVDCGCKVEYGSLTKDLLTHLLGSGWIVQTSVKVHKLYSDAPRGFHSILIYKLEGNEVEYHDPFVGSHLNIEVDRLISSAQDVGAFMAYKVS